MIAHDVYAESNPAYGAYMLVSFVRGFTDANPQGAELPVAYIALPIAMSGDLVKSFEGTNRKTGLGEWLERSPQVQVELAERLNSSLDVVTGAVRLGCFSNALIVSDSGRLLTGSHELKKDLASGLSAELARTVRHADRLGFWFATAGSAKTVYDMMGLTL